MKAAQHRRTPQPGGTSCVLVHFASWHRNTAPSISLPAVPSAHGVLECGGAAPLSWGRSFAGSGPAGDGARFFLIRDTKCALTLCYLFG